MSRSENMGIVYQWSAAELSVHVEESSDPWPFANVCAVTTNNSFLILISVLSTASNIDSAFFRRFWEGCLCRGWFNGSSHRRRPPGPWSFRWPGRRAGFFGRRYRRFRIYGNGISGWWGMRRKWRNRVVRRVCWKRGWPRGKLWTGFADGFCIRVISLQKKEVSALLALFQWLWWIETNRGQRLEVVS